MKLSFCVCLNHLFLFTFFWITIIFHSNEENDDYFAANSKTIKNSFSLENWWDILFETCSILLILIISSHILYGIFWVLSRDPITENWEERGWYWVTKSQRITQINFYRGDFTPNHRDLSPSQSQSDKKVTWHWWELGSRNLWFVEFFFEKRTYSHVFLKIMGYFKRT